MKFLKEIPLFSELDEKQLELLSKIALVRKYPKGFTVFTPFDRGEYFFILKKGAIKVSKISGGKEQIIKVFTKPAVFGEAASFTGGNFPAWAESIEDSEVILIPRNSFIQILKKDPEIGMKLLSVMAKRLIHLTKVIENLSLKSAISKLASYLYDRYLEEGKEISFSTSMAAMELGLTKETVSRMLSKLKELEAIEKNGRKVVITNPEILKDLSL